MAKFKPQTRKIPNKASKSLLQKPGKTQKPVEQLMQDAFQLADTQPQDAIALCKKILERTKIDKTAESAGLLWVKLAPEDANGWNMVGHVLMNNHKDTDAERALTIALKLDPTMVGLYENYARLLKEGGFLLKSLEMYDKGLQLEPTHKRLRTNRINVLLDMGLWDDAKVEVDWLMENYGNDPVSLGLVGRYYRAIKKPELALAPLQKAHEIDPNNVSILINLAGCMGNMMADHTALYKVWLKTLEAIRHSPQASLHQLDYIQITKFIAAYEQEPAKEGDMILRAKDLDLVTENIENIEATVIDEYRRLYHFHDFSIHTEEWSIYNDKDIYLNMMVTGSKDHLNFDDMGYVYMHEDKFPKIAFDKPHILLGGAENYYHWWVDFISRVGVIDEFPELRDLPLIVMDKLHPEQLETLKHVGINPDRLVYVPAHHTIHFKHLIMPSLTGRPMRPSGLPLWMKPMANDWSINWVREKFADWMVPNTKAPKRIFISRQGAKFRRCINEDVVYAIAKRHGFETLMNQNLSYRDQMEIYANAEAVMGPHGAGFTNLLFAPAGTTAIEMFPKNRAPTFYAEMCRQLDQRYIKFDGPITQLAKKMTIDFGDFYIEPADVERILKDL